MNQSPKSVHPVLTVIRKLAVDASCVFTVLTMLLLLVQWLIEQNLDKSINAAVFLMLLPLALAIAGADMIRRSDRLPTGAKVILHPLLCLGGVYLAYLPYQLANQFRAASVLVHLVFFALIYGVITAAVCIVSLATRRRKDDKESAPYVSQFNHDKKNGKDK